MYVFFTRSVDSTKMQGNCRYIIVEPPNNESFGTANFFHYLEIFFIERFKCIEVYANGTLEKFHYERFSLLGGFIIRGSTVAVICVYHK